jgi:hypothetical protein
LRNAALKGRALAGRLESDAARRNSLFSRSAISCWRIARVTTGTLRAHPYQSFQRGPGAMRSIYNRLVAGVVGGIARRQHRTLQTFYTELLRVSRELDDARALTWSAELSDTLGRSQAEIRGLLRELYAGARAEAGPQQELTPSVEARTGAPTGAGRADAGGVAGNWPYLAF